jgi:glutamate/tyrosine decarboxylase-like PLP-dependent enzyme
MTDRPLLTSPMTAVDIDTYLERFDWHPEPELIGFRDEATSRDALAALGQRTWDEALEFLYGIATERAMGDASAYAEARRRYYASDPEGARDGPGPAPSEPMRATHVIDEFASRLSRGLMNAQHPRQFGYFTPPPLPMSIMGEVLAQVANQGVDVWHAGPFAAFAEEEVVRWLCDLVGYGPGSFGLLTSGGVMANFMGMTLARDLHLGRVRGLSAPPRGRDLEGARVYTSDQTHFSIARALDELGFPADTLVVLPADDDFHLRGAPVAEAIARDRAAGLTPFAIAAVAGSTNTGSVDAIGELAAVAGSERLWLHVDAAYGGGARLSERDRDRVPDLQMADSVTVDPHKWFFQAYDIGGLLVRDARMLTAVFGGRAPEYYRGGETPGAGVPDDLRGGEQPDEHGAADQLNFYKLSFEGTRRWRALKLWMTWKHLGTRGFGKLIEANDDLAAYLAGRCAEADDFEALPEVPELSVVCFRHLPEGVEGQALDAHQDRLQAALELSGDGWLTTTRLRGATWLRAGVLNYLATDADIDRLLDALRQLAE